MVSPTAVVAYIALFVFLGFAFLAGNLLLGWLVRPKLPNAEKLEIYECGETTIGSSFVQFDLRFYVIALLFIIFDVEIAFFFPWATVYGKATHLMDPHLQVVQTQGANLALTPSAVGLYRELGVSSPTLQSVVVPGSLKSATPGQTPEAQATAAIRADASQLALLSIFDIGVFFAVLMVGFAYVWWRGDLDWVRAVTQQRAASEIKQSPVSSRPSESLLSTYH